MDDATRDLVGGAPFGEAVNQKIGRVKAAFDELNIDPPDRVVFYVGGQRVEAAWSGEGPRGVVRARVGDAGDEGAIAFAVPAPWLLGGQPNQADVDYLLERNRPEAATA